MNYLQTTQMTTNRAESDNILGVKTMMGDVSGMDGASIQKTGQQPGG